MTIRLKGGGGIAMRTASKADVGGSVSYNSVTVVTAGGTSVASVIQDANFMDYTGATYHSEGNVVITGMGAFNVVNMTPDVGVVSSDGLVTRLSSGLLRLIVRNSIITLPLIIDLQDKTEEPNQPRNFVSTVSGSLAAHIQGQIDSRIANTMTMSTNGKVFTTQNHTTPAYVRNASLWCSNVDLTCISPWNSNGGATRAGTLITPRHIINAAHYELSVGDTVRFVAADNTVHNRTILSKGRHPDYVPYSPDLTIYTLSSDLPAAIAPCKVMPSNWNNYLAQNYHNRPPALGLDQEEKALIIDFNSGGSFLSPTDADRLIFHEEKIVGDSGNPTFFIVNGELVLITVWTFGGVGSGTPVASHIPALNNMIVTADNQAGISTVADPTWPNAGGHYQLKPAVFSAFPSYT